MEFVVVIGAPCSGKSTYIHDHAKKDEPVFKVSGINPTALVVNKKRRKFIDEHRGEPGRGWIEACRFTKSLKRQLSGADFMVKRMDTPYSQCLKNIENSDRDNKKQWRDIIDAYF